MTTTRGSGLKTPPLAFRRIVSTSGFRTLVEHARAELGLVGKSSGWRRAPGADLERLAHASWTISSLCGLGHHEDDFVFNAVADGIDQALSTALPPKITMFVPDIGHIQAFQLAKAISTGELLPPPDDKRDSTRIDSSLDEPERTTRASSKTQKTDRSVIVTGKQALPQMIRNGRRIYLDVTDATYQDVKSAMHDVQEVRKEMRLGSKTTLQGERKRRDEEMAVHMAELHHEGMSYVEIGKEFGLKIYTSDVATGTCPQAVRFVKKGEELLVLRDKFDEVMIEIDQGS